MVKYAEMMQTMCAAGTANKPVLNRAAFGG
jgi:hypothetical protein